MDKNKIDYEVNHKSFNEMQAKQQTKLKNNSSFSDQCVSYCPPVSWTGVVMTTSSSGIGIGGGALE